VCDEVSTADVIFRVIAELFRNNHRRSNGQDDDALADRVGMDILMTHWSSFAAFFIATFCLASSYVSSDSILLVNLSTEESYIKVPLAART